MEIGVLWQRQIRPAKLAKSKRAWRRAPEETNEKATTQLAQSDLRHGAGRDRGNGNNDQTSDSVAAGKKIRAGTLALERESGAHTSHD
jgi:hypothetical protein